ncbi:MAG: RND transporter [Betaproteobacteria bacterium HGW-Betaproteobacteria-16]|nr:MAG: RND transporter [Betaproteobacteria bacterium HGW-Betaproteobacteria-16]
MKWLDRIPLLWLVLIAAWLAVAPVAPEPHLVEKLRMLSQGNLQKPIDIFDLLLHSVPLCLLVARLVRMWLHRERGTQQR